MDKSSKFFTVAGQVSFDSHEVAPPGTPTKICPPLSSNPRTVNGSVYLRGGSDREGVDQVARQWGAGLNDR